MVAEKFYIFQCDEMQYSYYEKKIKTVMINNSIKINKRTRHIALEFPVLVSNRQPLPAMVG